MLEIVRNVSDYVNKDLSKATKLTTKIQLLYFQIELLYDAFKQ